VGRAVGGLRLQVRGIAARGCAYLQLGDTSLAYLNDPAQRAELAAQGRDNALTRDEQVAKLALVVETAQEV
jgi:5-methyltetrahydropteroyltriglutamate--homocysteine methyltransferase